MTHPPDRPASPDQPVLPDQTGDDTDVGWGESRDQDDEQRLRDELPPHHVDRD